MSSPPASSNPSSLSGSSHFYSLLPLENNIEELKDTLSHPKDILSQPEDSLPVRKSISSFHSDTLKTIVEEHLKDTLPSSVDALSLHSPALPPLADVLSQPKYMVNRDRSRHRNVHVYNTSDRHTIIGGLRLTDKNDDTHCVTNANFYAMVEIITIVTSVFTLQNESNITIKKDNLPLQPGNYYIHALQPFQLSNELIQVRTISLEAGSRVKAFTDAVRLRDGRCAITGNECIDDDDYTALEAAHVFPLAYEQQWKQFNYGRWISTPPDGQEIKGGKINSAQNGLLLECSTHKLFDTYKVSINPDDNYKIVCFYKHDGKGIAGKHMDRRHLDGPQRPAAQLLRWHFRQAVLANMKGAGEPTFELDFPPGSDMIGSILQAPRAAERMEFELFNRLATQFDLTE